MNFQDEILNEGKKLITRRHFFKNCGVGLGSVALTSLLNENLFAAQQSNNPLAPKQPHFPGKAKRVIYVFQAGGPSHLDLFDYKPALVKYNGKKPPEEMLKGIQNVFINRDAALYASEFKFARHGQSGAEISEALPYLAKVVDDICIVKTIATDAINHAPAQIFMNTGSVQFGRPSFGSWVTYGLGSESQNLPAFVVLTSANGTSGGSSNWGLTLVATRTWMALGAQNTAISLEWRLYIPTYCPVDFAAVVYQLDPREPGTGSMQPNRTKRTQRPWIGGTI